MSENSAAHPESTRSSVEKLRGVHDGNDEEKMAKKGHGRDGTPETSTHSEATGTEPDEQDYPPMKKVLLAMVALYLAFFLVALDRTIIGTAVPTISREFNSFDDIAWYESGFLLPLCVFQLSFGLVYRYYSTKWVLFTLIAIFEIGSIVCAAAPTSNALIVGRVITGIGAAGIAPGVYLFITQLVPLQKRPAFLGSLGSAFGISSILGPILGGYLTSVSWRWCFWINVPIGGVSLVLLLILAPSTPSLAAPATSWRGRILDLDPLGFFLIAPSVTCLLFALQFGSNDRDWTQPRVIALFVLFGILFICFGVYQVWLGDRATLPPRIMCQRNVFWACCIAFCIGSVLVLFAFYMPIWFQVVQGKSASQSGLALLPLLLSNVVSVVISGGLVGKVGYSSPFAIFGGAVLVAGSALITTWTVDINVGKRIGYQILTGIGIGVALQQPTIAVQTTLSNADNAIGISVLNFVNFLGGSVFVTASQTLLYGRLVNKLGKIVPDLDTAMLAGSGASDLANLVPASKLTEAVGAYNDSMRLIWYLALGLACFAFLGAFGLEWKSFKTKKKL